MIKNLWAKIAYGWFLFMLILVGLFVPKKVFALTNITPNSWDWNISYYNGHCSSGSLPNCDYTISDIRESGWTHSDFTIPSGNYGYINFTTLRVFLNSNLQTGLSYTMNFNVWVRNRSNEIDYKNIASHIIMLASNSGSYSGVNSAFITSYSCRAGIAEGTTAQVNFSCVFTPSSGINYLYLKLPYSSYSRNYFEYWGSTKPTITYDNAQVDAINQQTSVIIDNSNKIDNSINNINDNITDDSVDDPDEMFDDFNDLMPENGVITTLIALPITLYTKILNSINGTCSQFSIGSLYGTNIIFPCIEVSDYLGSTLWGVIDIIMSAFLVLAISKKMIKAFNNFSSMKEGDVIDD